MKNLLRLFAFSAFALFSFSCTEELSNPEEPAASVMVSKSYVADLDADTKTRNVDQHVYWLKGDKINIIGENTDTYSRAGNLSEDGKRANFDATVAQGDVIYGFYPYDEELRLSNGSLYSSVPSSQSGYFADANYSFAVEKDGFMTFHNATALFEIFVDPHNFPNVTDVVIESLSTAPLSGDMVITPDDDEFDVSKGSNTDKRILVSLANTCKKGQKAYVAVLPVHLTKGLIFRLKDANGKDVKTATLKANLNLLPNSMYRFGDISSFEHLDSEEIFCETFSSCNGTGGRDNVANSFGDLIEDSQSDDYTDLSGWTFYNCHEGKGCIAIGDDNDEGYAITPAIGVDPATNPMGLATLTFSSMTLDKSGVSVLGGLSIVGSGVISHTTSVLGDDAFEQFTVYIMHANADTRVKFSGVEHPYGQFFLDDVKFIDSAPTDFLYLNVNQDVWYIEADVTSLSIPYQANVDLIVSYSAYPKSFVKMAYTMSYNVKVNIEPNHSVEPAMSRIVVFTADKGLPASENYHYITIYQAGCSRILGDKESLAFLAEGGSDTVNYEIWNFEDDVQITAVSSVPGQFTVAPIDGGFTITAAENTTDDAIEGTVTLKAKDGKGHEDTFEIAVAQAAYPVVTLDNDAIEFPYTATDTTVTVSYKNFLGDVTVSAVSDNDAFSTSVNGDVVTISVDANETTEPIEGTVTITVSDGTNSLEKTVAVSQACLLPQTIYFAEASYSAYFDGTGFVTPTVSGAQTTVTYSISQNSFASIDASTGEITFSPVANGTATVTATAVAENNYVKASASYQLVYLRLPADYTETASLTSDGTQYIDTKFTPDQNSRVVIDFQINDNSRNNFIYGAAVSGGGTPVDCFGFNSSASAFYVKFGNVRVGLGDPDAQEHVIDHDGASFTFDGKMKTFEVGNFTCPSSMFLFHINASEPAGHVPAKATIFSCKVYDNGTLVRDFIPCTEDSGSGMYDVKNGEFYPLATVE